MKPRPLAWNTPTDAGRPHEASLAASVKTTPIGWGRPGSISLALTGTPTGTITVYVSNDHDPMGTGVSGWNGNWDSINALLSPAIVQPAGSAATYFFDIPLRPAFIYIDYARSSGTGTIKGVASQEG